jgi:hypothetical protein
MIFFSLPNRVSWLQAIEETIEDLGVTQKAVCGRAGIDYETWRKNTYRLRSTGDGMPYEQLQRITDTLNSWYTTINE